MTNPLLIEAVLRHAPTDGVHSTGLAGLTLYRYSQPVDISLTLYEPAMCLLAQGAKRVLLGDHVHTYHPGRHLIASQHLPAAGQVIAASPESPYLCICLAIEAREVVDLLLNIGEPLQTADHGPAEGMYTEESESTLLDATVRLVRLLDNPRDVDALGASVKREVFYRLLTAPHGWRLARSASSNSHDRRIGRVIAWLRENFNAPLRIADLAEAGHMSESALFQHFKAVTAMTPLQYQKRLRLLEARRLLVAHNADSATIAHRVGYESPSQFSREYARLFGEPPRRDQARLQSGVVA